MQLSLIQNEAIQKRIEQVPITKLVVSKFNPRQTRLEDDINKLAERIARNGFEITRALWARPQDEYFEVFAGGTRLQAAKRANLDVVPVVIHENASDEDVVRLAYLDNENDEYHAEVPIVEVWANYAALSKSGWTQQQIAGALGLDRTIVSLRLKLHKLPREIKSLVSHNYLAEAHLTEIAKLLVDSHFEPWLTTEALQLAVCNEARKLSVRDTKKIVEKHRVYLQLADDFYNQLGTPWNEHFVQRLTETEARGKAAVQSAYNHIARLQVQEARRHEEELARQQSEAEVTRIQAEQEAERAQRVQAALQRVVNFDVLQVDLPDGIQAVIADPPYGMSFQSNRRVVSQKARRINNDDASAFDLTRDALARCYSHMTDNSTVFVFASQALEWQMRCAVVEAGFVYKGTYIWDKPNHGSGDLEGTFAPKHECIIHAVKGNPKLRYRPTSVLKGVEFLSTQHPTPKPLDLLTTLITATTDETDLVVDLFMGCGSTLVAAHKSGRRFWGCDIDTEWHREASDNIYSLVQEDE